MRKELDEALCAKYPKIFKDRHGDMRNTLMCWGFSCGDGWYTLIDRLCRWLQGMTDNNPHLPERYPQITAVQVKEKYGSLRFYVNGASDSQDGAIDMAEQMSSAICEECGHPGEIRTTSGCWRGWYKTVCDTCADKLGFKKITKTYEDELEELEKEENATQAAEIPAESGPQNL